MTGGGVGADDAGRQQVQCVRFVADDHSMASVIAAVETGDVVDLRADQIRCLYLCPRLPHWAPIKTIPGMLLHLRAYAILP